MVQVAYPTRECTSCGNTYQPNTLRQKLCKKNCGRSSASKNSSRTVKRKNNDLTFIAVDGEGVDRPNGRHEYVMLSIGDQTLTNDDGGELHYDQIFTALWEQYLQNPDAVFVGFSLGYDFNMWTRHFTEREAYQLYHKSAINKRKRTGPNPEPWPVYVGGKWEVDILAGRRFRLAPHYHKGLKDAPDHCRCGSAIPYPTDFGPIGDECDFDDFCRPSKNPRMYVCDTFGFWQCSFLAAINPKSWPGTPIATDEEYAIISEGKSLRSAYNVRVGETWFLADMAKYNRAENAVLARITEKLNEGFMGIGLKLDRANWYGPGRAAQAWLNTLIPRNEWVPSKSNPDKLISPLSREHHNDVLEEWQTEIGRLTYYGGWFEQFAHGHIPGTIWEYDINSAYPAVIAELPCLLHGRWTRGSEREFSELPTHGITAVHGTFVGSNRYIGGLPYRTRQGAIVHPHETVGWYWSHEISAAIDAGLIDDVVVKEWVHYEPCNCPPPMRGIANLYAARIDPAVGKNSPRGKSYKLVYNSAYGKFAQSIGNPRFGNGIYASLITAGCRATILRAIATHPMGPRAVTMVATDGVYFTSPHPSLDMTPNKLGCWEESSMTGMTQLMPGIYWNDNARAAVRDGSTIKVKSRGISGRDLAESMEALDRLFDDFAINGEWPEFKLKVGFAMTSAKQAITRNQWHTACHVAHNEDRTINSRPINKRDHSTVYYEDGMARTPIRVMDDPETTPYSKMFGYLEYMEELRQQLNWGMTPDGELSDLLMEWLS